MTNEVKRNCMRATECGKEARSINCEPMDKNRIEGDTQQGEQAIICKAYDQSLCGVNPAVVQ